MIDINKTVANNIRKYRQINVFTQESLALESGLHRAYIGQVERCDKHIGISNLYTIAQTLGVDIRDFFDENLFTKSP